MPAAGFCVAETPTCNEARLNLAEQTGSLNQDNPGRRQALTGFEPRRAETSMDNQPAGAGRCFAHRTEPAATDATFE